MMSSSAAAHYIPPSFNLASTSPLPPAPSAPPIIVPPPPASIPQRPEVLPCDLQIEMTTLVDRPMHHFASAAEHGTGGRGGQDLAPVGQPLQGDSPPPSSGLSPSSGGGGRTKSTGAKNKYLYGFTEQYPHAGSLTDGAGSGQRDMSSPSSSQNAGEECFSPGAPADAPFKSYSVSQQQFKSEVV